MGGAAGVNPKFDYFGSHFWFFLSNDVQKVKYFWVY